MVEKAPTVLDVARAAGVGASTVSRCLHGGHYVRPEVFERVAEAIEKLGYVPNGVARSLRNQRTHTIGIVFPHITNAFFSLCVEEIERAAAARGWSVILLTHREDAETQFRQLANLHRLRVDGVILTSAPTSDLKRIRRELSDRPLVALDRPLWKSLDTVTLENRRAAVAATKHLLSHGYRRIACVTARPEIYTFQARIEGFRKAMDASGLRGEVIIAEDYPGLASVLRSALKRKLPPQAILSLSNMATAAVVEETQLGLMRSGRKTAFLGFDDFDFAELVKPAITVVRQPVRLMALESIRLLSRQIEAADPSTLDPEVVHLDGELILRESCGCARQASD